MYFCLNTLPNFSNNFPTFIQLFVLGVALTFSLHKHDWHNCPVEANQEQQRQKNHHLGRNLPTNLGSSCGRSYQPAATQHVKNLNVSIAVKREAFEASKPDRCQANPHLLFREDAVHNRPRIRPGTRTESEMVKNDAIRLCTKNKTPPAA